MDDVPGVMTYHLFWPGGTGISYYTFSLKKKIVNCVEQSGKVPHKSVVKRIWKLYSWIRAIEMNVIIIINLHLWVFQKAEIARAASASAISLFEKLTSAN